MNALLYPGFIEELVDIVELQDDKIVVSRNIGYVTHELL